MFYQSNSMNPPAYLVLILDDEKSWLRLVTSQLRGCGWSCLPAGSGAEAVEVINHSADEVGAAVLDVNLDDLDGWKVAESLRAANPNLPIVMMTGSVDAVVLQKVSKLRRVIVLEKPFTVDRLKGAVFEAASAN